MPRALVVHSTVGTFESAVGWLTSRASGRSAHYVISLDGEVAQLVDESDTAFHAGNVHAPDPSLGEVGDPNLWTVGLEFVDDGDPHGVQRSDAQYRAGALLIARVARRWGISVDSDHVIAHGRLNARTECPANLDVARLLREARTLLERSAHPWLVVLLPVRNGAEDLPGWFESVAPIADAVIALDDGSTDDTRALLEAHPLVEVVLENPPRTTYAGWDDATNRQRLLDAAADTNPDWVLFLDADERLDPSDAAALRTFVETDALPGCAYGFRCFRMVEPGHYDQSDLWVYRLFAYRPDARLPTARLHLVPVPVDIPRDRWVRTTLRIQHFGGATENRRRERFTKYAESDPVREFQATYDHLLAGPGATRPFRPRAADEPVVPSGVALGVPDLDDLDLDGPSLTAVVIARDDEDSIARTLSSVVNQECPEQFETIVVTSGTDGTASRVRTHFSGVRLVELDHPALPGEARNAGLRLARGDVISFPGSHVELPPGSLAARLRAHQDGWAMVTGTTSNGTPSRAGWASYFLDHSSVLANRPSGALDEPPAHCSYLRSSLIAVGGFPEHLRAGEDTVVNNHLFRLGYPAFRAADVQLVHVSRCDTVVKLLRHHYTRGRAQGRILLERNRGLLQTLRRERSVLLGYVGRRLARTDARVDSWGGDLRSRYREVRGLVRAGVIAAWVGTVVELLQAVPRSVPVSASSSSPPTSEDRSAHDRFVSPLRTREPGHPERALHRPLFVHIPKCAGTSVVRILEREYGATGVFRLYGDVEERIAALQSLSPDEEEEICALAGHVPFGLGRVAGRETQAFTLLRHPVDRVISHYFYVLERRDEPVHADALEGVSCLADYVVRSPIARLVNNGMTRFLGGDAFGEWTPASNEHLSISKRRIHDGEILVGLQERFRESVAFFRQRFGWGWPVVEHTNHTVGRPPISDVEPTTIALIEAHNALDLELYDMARTVFEQRVIETAALADDVWTLGLLDRARREHEHGGSVALGDVRVWG